jgi:hypothetical protein
LGDAFHNVSFTPVPMPSDPMKPLYTMMAAMGICKCNKCSLALTADEIMVNGVECFKCKPDTRSLEF